MGLVVLNSSVFFHSNNLLTLVCACRKMELSKECYIQASLNCSKYTCDQLTASWNLSASIVSDKCVAIVQPKCDTTAARACILELWNTVDGAKDFETACRCNNELFWILWNSCSRLDAWRFWNGVAPHVLWLNSKRTYIQRKLIHLLRCKLLKSELVTAEWPT